MDRIWLTCCKREDMPVVRSELEARDVAPRMLRVGDPKRLAAVARRFSDEDVAVAIGLRGISLDIIERAVGDIARGTGTADILVFADTDDPGDIARCFYAGATEVITTGEAGLPLEPKASRAACAEEEAGAGRDASPPDDGETPPWIGGDGEAHDGAAAGNDSPAAVPAGCDRDVLNDTDGKTDEYVAIASEARPDGPCAPLITMIAGRGGCGRTTLIAAMATCAARAGLRVAVLDLDLMFGTLPLVLGVDAYMGFEGLSAHAVDEGLAERDIEATAMRVGPGLTLWGPCAVPEHAELVAQPIERLVGVLRGMADVVLVDTSTCWGDAVAMAVAACDRCLVVGSSGAAQVHSAKRAIELAVRLGVPKTRMTCVFNRVGARGCGEEQALHFEMGVSLRSRARIAYGGDEVTGMASFGKFDSLMAGAGPFAQSVRTLTGRLLQELGCPVDTWLLNEEQRRAATEERPRIRLPWASRGGEER